MGLRWFSRRDSNNEWKQVTHLSAMAEQFGWGMTADLQLTQVDGLEFNVEKPDYVDHLALDLWIDDISLVP